MAAPAPLPSLLIKLYEEQIALLQAQVLQLKAVSADGKGANIGTEGTEGKRKKVKKEGPKRALSAYNLFMMDHLKAIKEDHRSVPPKEAMAFISKEWSALDAKDKADYLKRADQLKVTNAAEAASGQTFSSDAPAPTLVTDKKVKVSDADKSASSSGKAAVILPISSTVPKAKPAEVPDAKCVAMLTQDVGLDDEKKKKKKKKHHSEDGDHKHKVSAIVI
jgi:hypothetical protein